MNKLKYWLTAAGLTVTLLATSAQASSEPYIGEVMCTGYRFNIVGWALADGRILNINSNQALFSLLGTQFGGNGTTTFALPNLNGRAILSSGPNQYLGAATDNTTPPVNLIQATLSTPAKVPATVTLQSKANNVFITQPATVNVACYIATEGIYPSRD